MQLIITADDLGIDARRDHGIFEAYAAGAITQASLLVNGKSAATAARRARDVGLPLGLHLDLTELPSSAAPAAIASLLDERGQKRGKHGLRAGVAAGRVVPEHVVAEAESQLDEFARLVGEPARHLDGHQHAHVVPAIALALAQRLAARGIRTVRIPWQPALRHPDAEAQRFYNNVSDDARAARAEYARAAIGTTDGFVGLDLVAAPAEALRTAVAAVAAALGEACSIELMTHPGYPGQGVDDFNESPAREGELRVLCQLPFAPLVAAGRVTLTTFDGLRDRPAVSAGAGPACREPVR